MAIVGVGGSAGGGIAANTERTVVLPPGTHKIVRTADLVYLPKPCSKDEGTIRLATGTAYAESSGDNFIQTIGQAEGNDVDYYSNWTMTGTPVISNHVYAANNDLMWYNVPADTVWDLMNMGYAQISSLASAMVAWVWVVKNFGGGDIKITDSGPGSDSGSLTSFFSNGSFARDQIRFNMSASSTESPIYITRDAAMIPHIRGPANIVISSGSAWLDQDSVEKFWIQVREQPLEAGAVTLTRPGQAPVTLGIGSTFKTDLMSQVTYKPTISGHFEIQTQY